MKKIIVVLFASMMSFGSFISSAVDVKTKENKSTLKEKVEVFYFHFTRRCVTCKAVETEAKSAVLALYPNQIKDGLVEFTEVNLDNENSNAAVAKAKAQGQGLIVVKGDKRVDLTAQGFMYAISNPERLQNEIKKAVDSMLTSK